MSERKIKIGDYFDSYQYFRKKSRNRYLLKVLGFTEKGKTTLIKYWHIDDNLRILDNDGINLDYPTRFLKERKTWKYVKHPEIYFI